MKKSNFMLLISFSVIFIVIVILLIVLVFIFIYHLVLFLFSDDISTAEDHKENVGYFFRHYKFCRTRLFTISDVTSPNRVWVNPASRYHHQSHNEQYQSNRYDRTFDDYGNKNYNSSHYKKYNDDDDYSSSHSSRSRQYEREKYAPQSGSNFSFTKALDSVHSSSSSVCQSSLQERVKPVTSSSPATSSFSFVKALQETNRNVPIAASGDSSLYSKLEDLAEGQKLQFKASEFEWGKIPLLPPSVELC